MPNTSYFSGLVSGYLFVKNVGIYLVKRQQRKREGVMKSFMDDPYIKLLPQIFFMPSKIELLNVDVIITFNEKNSMGYLDFFVLHP